jgi:hypothetical protein
MEIDWVLLKNWYNKKKHTKFFDNAPLHATKINNEKKTNHIYWKCRMSW